MYKPNIDNCINTWYDRNMNQKDHVMNAFRLDAKADEILRIVAKSRGVTMTSLVEDAIMLLYSGEAAAVKAAAKNGAADD